MSGVEMGANGLSSPPSPSGLLLSGGAEDGCKDSEVGTGVGVAYMPSLRRVGALRGVGSLDLGPSRSRATPMYFRFGC